jgi:hypothetical protein
MSTVFRRTTLSSTLCAASIAALAGCGGSTGAGDNLTDGGTEAAIEAGGSSGFNPGAIGSLVPPRLDAGAGAVMLPDASAVVSPQVVDGCVQLCDKEQAANCPGFSSLSSCMVGCELLLKNPGCASMAQNLFSCVNGATASCDSSGNPTFANCGLQEIASAGCFISNTVDPTLQAPCATYCAAVQAAKCPNDNPSGCQGSCQILGNLFGCNASWTAYVTCANGSTLTCGGDGKASASACIAQAASFWECAAGELLVLTADGG